jgi:hypothetical protein
MNSISITPEMSVNKGNKWITVEEIQYTYGIIKIEPIEPIQNFNFDHISKDFTKSFAEIVDDINDKISDDLYNNEEMFLEQETNNIPLKENQIFGIEFAIITEKTTEQGFIRKLSYQIKYPDKQNEGAYITTETHFDHEINTYQFIWQKLDTEAEMAFGQWTFTIIDEQTGDQLLVENFNVFFPSI